MNLHEIYLHAMEASIQNAEQWLRDASVLLANGSFAHARALQNFAGEETVKALGCWLVAKGLLSSDHPDVKIQGRESIFKSHYLKNQLSLLLGTLSILPEINKGSIIGALIVSKAAGRWGADKRMEWMYVDIVKVNGDYTISNPLEMDVGDFQAGLNLMFREIQFLKRLIKSADTKTIEILKQDLGNFFTEE